ncbi:signal peptidase I [Paenibacillus sp. UMB4589-SE434]|uniref:signal peptidase I n=1 Tax=Paenibacillus sp. UMB4589-SE434 TaxID=3046314 RepID=UPI00254EE807|nr:signal peptidase I [Paenibacillus sp. UMB4589-SE434]MDK8179254.1 signal peptidase I [Paenibacillus sp. UMB4589-SE434]
MSLRSIRQYVVILLITIGVSLVIQKVAYAQIVVQQHSMEVTYHEGDRLLENKWLYHFAKPERGDVVILQDPDEDIRLIKRVVGIAGDKLELRQGKLLVNGSEQIEPYVSSPTFPVQVQFPIVVPEDAVFVLGDNRGNSKDSRVFGAIPLSLVEGKVITRLWPL